MTPFFGAETHFFLHFFIETVDVKNIYLQNTYEIAEAESCCAVPIACDGEFVWWAGAAALLTNSTQ